MSEDLQGQLTGSAAEVYENFFVPALFRPWATRVADAARLEPGHTVLDVACGTGVLAREAASRVGSAGAVVGIDPNEGMLTVARERDATIEWRAGRAESLPFEDAAFDAVLSQFGLMFFEDQRAGLREMWRVLRPGGRLVVAVWDALEHSPGYAAMVALLDRLFGARIANELRAPYSLGDPDELRILFTESGIPDVDLRTPTDTVRFPSIESWVHIDVKGWTLASLIDDDQYQRLREAAARELTAFVQPDGSVAFPAPAHVVTARKA